MPRPEDDNIYFRSGDWAPGTKVRLRSGGPKMTIRRSVDAGYRETRWYLVDWIDIHGHAQSKFFPKTLLKRCWW